MGAQTKKISSTKGNTDSTHYIVAKTKDGEDRKYLSLFSNEGQYGEMIGSVINERSLERFTEFAEFVVSQVEAGNSVYLNFNQRRQS